MFWTDTLVMLLKQSALHWLFSACVGALVWLLISTISSLAFRAYYGRAWQTPVRVCFTVGLGLVFALLSAWTLHCYMDYYEQVAVQIAQHTATGEMIEVVPMPGWWTAPINAPLQINTDPNRYAVP